MSFCFLEGKQWDRAQLPEKDFSVKSSLPVFPLSFLYVLSFLSGWISVGGPEVVLYCMKLLVNPQWIQFFRVVPCPTWQLKLNTWNEAFGNQQLLVITCLLSVCSVHHVYYSCTFKSLKKLSDTNLSFLSVLQRPVNLNCLLKSVEASFSMTSIILVVFHFGFLSSF